MKESVPPYVIAGGIPAIVIRFRWTADQIKKHEEELYTEELRLDASKSIRFLMTLLIVN